MKMLISCLLGIIVLVLPSVTSAGTQHNASGFAWSPTIGWISFNSTNDHDSASAGVQPSASDYGVNFDYSTGDVTGYAWSSNIGWIQFGGLSGFPTGSGTQAINAKIQGSGLVGWAKALSADGAGWDGWISLAGTGYGASKVGSALSGYAWGSDVVGWVLLDVVLPSLSPPTLSLTASASSVALGDTVTLTWSSANAASCVAWNAPSATGSGLWPGLRNASGGSLPVTPTVAGSHVYSMTCSNSSGASSASVAVTAVDPPCTGSSCPVALTLAASKASVERGSPFALTWESTNATSCAASTASAGNGSWSGTVAIDGTQLVTPLLVGSLSYQLTCSGASGSLTRTAVVEVLEPPVVTPAVTLRALPSSILLGAPVTLAWVTTNASSCVAWAPPQAGQGSWSGTKPVGAGSLSVKPTIPGTYSYHMTCSNPSGQNATHYVSVKVNPAPLPTVSVSASPASIALGDTVTLTWSSANATSCAASTASAGAGSWPGPLSQLAGSKPLVPSTVGTKAYAVTCTGGAASATGTVSVSVNPPSAAPTVSVSASPASIALGDTVTLTWSSANATSCAASTASAGAGSWPGPLSQLAGSKPLVPSTVGTKAYAVTCTGGAASATGTVSVSVNPVTTDPGCPAGQVMVGGVCVPVGPPLVCPDGTPLPCAATSPALSITASPGSLGFRFVGGLPATSRSVTIRVVRSGFSGPVDLSVLGLYPDMPAGDHGVSIGYNFGSASGPDEITIPVGEDSTTLKVRMSRKISNACGTTVSSGCTPYEIRIRASAAGVPSADDSLGLDMDSVRPVFEEQ